MAVLVIVAVFAAKGDSRAREGFGDGEDFVQLRHYLFEGYPTCQGEIQVFRKPIVLKPAASQGRGTFYDQHLVKRMVGDPRSGSLAVLRGLEGHGTL